MEKERELFERLREFTVPELCDGAGVFSAMDYHIKPWIGRTKIVGRALTVKVPAGEGAIVSRAIELAGEGDVIVIAGQGVSSVPTGETTAASARGFRARKEW